jgi:hypothetical protein
VEQLDDVLLGHPVSNHVVQLHINVLGPRIANVVLQPRCSQLRCCLVKP